MWPSWPLGPENGARLFDCGLTVSPSAESFAFPEFQGWETSMPRKTEDMTHSNIFKPAGPDPMRTVLTREQEGLLCKRKCQVCRRRPTSPALLSRGMFDTRAQYFEGTPFAQRLRWSLRWTPQKRRVRHWCEATPPRHASLCDESERVSGSTEVMSNDTLAHRPLPKHRHRSRPLGRPHFDTQGLNATPGGTL